MSRLEQLRLRCLEHFLDRLDHAAQRRSSSGPAHLATGRRGERAAYFYLRRRGFIVTARGWRTSRARGDLDLVAWESDTLCFIEVKTRTTRAVAPAWLAVDQDKRRVLRRLARHYMRQLPNRDVPARFDILSIYFETGKPPAYELMPHAFGFVEN